MEDLDRAGWILAPGETIEALFARRERAEKAQVVGALKGLDLEPAWKITEDLFRFQLRNIPILYEKKGLSLWQGAALWSYFTEKGEAFPVLQIRKTCFCDQEELIAHEMVHAARFAFKEPWFEEVLAYKTSKSKVKQFFGPLCVFPVEAFFLMGSSWVGFLGALLWGESFFWIPSMVVFGFLARLLVLQGLFGCAKKKLKKRGDLFPLASLLRMSDRDIIRVAFSKK